jgi:hypothetical protein
MRLRFLTIRVKVAPALQPADKTAAGFTFYHGYLSVVYGLIATEGLGQLGTIKKMHEWEFGIPPFLLLFLGVFVIGLHFWFICSTIDESTHKFYRVLAGDRWAYAFLFVDAIVATSFAWLVLAMFHGISSGREALFRWFLAAAVGSLAYDLYSRILVITADKRARRQDALSLVISYGTSVKCWLIQDSSFFLGALLLFVLDKYGSWSGRVLSVCFVLVSVGVLALDVKFLPDSPSNSENRK